MRTNVDVTFHPSWWHRHAGVDFDEKFFFDPDYHTEADIRMRRILWEYFGDYGIGEEHPEARPVLFSHLIACGFLYSELLGCEVVFKKDDAPQVMCAHLTDERVRELKAPSLDEHPLWQKVQRQIDFYLHNFGRVEAAVNLMGIQNIALDLRGEELFFDYYDEPELEEILLSVATDLSIDIGRRLYAVSDGVSGGVTSIVKQACPEVYLTSNCSVTMLSNEQYVEHLLPYDRKLAEAFPCFGIHHCGPNTEAVIDGYLRVPNLKFLEIGAGSDLDAVAKAIGNREIKCCIRYSPVALKADPKEEIARKTDEAVRAFGGDERLCFSCVGIDGNTDPEDARKYLGVFREQRR